MCYTFCSDVSVPCLMGLDVLKMFVFLNTFFVSITISHSHSKMVQLSLCLIN
jgi:hypothetical protein